MKKMLFSLMKIQNQKKHLKYLFRAMTIPQKQHLGEL